MLRHVLTAVLGPKGKAERADIALNLPIAASLLGKGWLIRTDAHFGITITTQRSLIDIRRTDDHVLIIKDGKLGMDVDHVPKTLTGLGSNGARLWIG